MATVFAFSFLGGYYSYVLLLSLDGAVAPSAKNIKKQLNYKNKRNIGATNVDILAGTNSQASLRPYKTKTTQRI